jgi:membrane protease subunit HflC
MMWNVLFYAIVATFALLLRFGTFIVFEGSNVILTQFGEIIGDTYATPGLYFRVPVIHQAHFFDVRIQTWEGYQNYVPTRDKLYVGVETVAHWRIEDPARFLETLGTEEATRERMDSILNGAVKDVVSAHPLVDTVRSTNSVLATRGKAERIANADIADGMSAKVEDEILTDLESVVVGRVHLSNKMLQLAASEAEPLGIKVVAVYIKKISYHPPVERMVFDRMISERHRVAERLRSIGRSESERIRGEASQRVQEIVSPAVQEAERIKGEADAEATELYARTFGQDADFYRFWRTLSAYRKALPERAEIIGSLDSNFFRMMRERADFDVPERVPDADGEEQAEAGDTSGLDAAAPVVSARAPQAALPAETPLTGTPPAETPPADSVTAETRVPDVAPTVSETPP